MTAAEPWTVRRLLEWTAGFFTRRSVDSPRLSAELLLAHVLGAPRIKLYTDYDRVISEKDLATYRALVQRGAEHEPIAYLTGKSHFFNLEFEVSSKVLIPRPDTETLVENVLQLVRNTAGFEASRILELCSGSGCIAAALAHHMKSGLVVATEISGEAVAIARRNVERLGLGERVTVAEGDLFGPLKELVDVRPFDLLVANPPYIPSSQIENLDPSVRNFEPLLALDGGIDGLSIHTRILQKAGEHVRAGGRVYLEIQFDQGAAAKALAEKHGDALEDIRILKDYGGRDRVLTARRK